MTKHQAWIISENAAGMYNQAVGLANAMRLSYQKIYIRLRKPWDYFPSGFYPLPQFAIHNLQDMLPSQCPKIVITSGKRSVYASLMLKSKLGKKVTTIHIQDPKINPKHFDFVIAPQHDSIQGSNVYKTQFAVNHINASLLSEAAAEFPDDFSTYQRPLIMVVLGGTNRHFHFDNDSISHMNNQIEDVCQSMNANAIVLFSRRTPPSIKNLCFNSFNSDPLITVWDESKPNPYLALLSRCDYVFLTCDSYSMISEALSAQKKTYIYKLPPKKAKSRLQSFIQNSLNKNLISTIQYPLPHYEQNPCSETQKIANALLSKLS